MTCGAVGTLCKMLVQGGSLPRSFNASSERYRVITEGMTLTPKYAGHQWGVGEIGQRAGARRLNALLYEGSFELECSKENLRKWLPRALMSQSAASPFSSQYRPSLNHFDMLLEKEVETFRYNIGLVNELVISGTSSPDDPLMRLGVGVVCFSHEEGAAYPTPEPPVPNSSGDLPYTFYETELLLNETLELPINRIIVSIKNNLVPVMSQSITAQQFRSMGREITVTGEALFNADSLNMIQNAPNEMFNTTFRLSHPDAGVVTLNLKNLQNIGMNHPPIPGKTFLPLPFKFRAGKPGINNPELVATVA